MNDMSHVIVPKSDQLNSDDLLTTTRTIKVTKVEIRPGTEQPVSIFFEGDNGKPWKCCKSMARVIVRAWGKYTEAYVGRSLTLYRDDKVKFGGMEVGGIRISHMSDIAETLIMPLTVSRASKKMFTVKPLVASDSPKSQPEPTADTSKIDEAIALCRLTTNPEELEQIAKDAPKLKGWTDSLKEEMRAVCKEKRQQFKQERQPGE